MKHLIFLVLLVGYCSARSTLKIVNGTNAEEGEFPYMVSLRYGLSHQCGGTIINSKHILTAAHCVCENNVPKNPENYNVQYGSIFITRTSERTVGVDTFICADYSAQSAIYDVAIIRLKETLPMDGLWQSVYLQSTVDTSYQHDGWVVGWGRLWQDGPIPAILQKLHVVTIEDYTCGLRYNNQHNICTRSVSAGGICNGDSGGALIISDGGQVGIASFITATCGETSESSPNGFSRVPTYYQWIIDNSNL